MSRAARFLAVDLGASSGRVVAGDWDGSRFSLTELHRFWNGPVRALSRHYTDSLYLWTEIKKGLARAGEAAPAGIAVDSWGVDYGLLDRAGRLVGNPVHYRDSRTDGVMEKVFTRVPREEMFGTTGIQFMQLNTVFQLAAMVLQKDPQLDAAETLLFTPDLFHYWLCGTKANEYTMASTSQMLDCRKREWADAMLAKLSIPSRLLLPPTPPGTVLGELRPGVAEEAGWSKGPPVIAAGSHDTASAVAAVPELDDMSAYLSSGTWSLMGVEVREPVLDSRALKANITNEGGVAGTYRLLKNIMGLWLVQECTRQWEKEGKKAGWDELVAEAEEAPALRSFVDPDAPEFFKPTNMPEAIREWCARTGQPAPDTVGAVVRCCLESLALKYRVVLEDLSDLTGRKLEAVRVVGGGSRNRLLNRFTADACGVPVVAGPAEATAIGNVMMQAIATGVLPDVAAGRRAVAASFERDTVEPGKGGGWDGAYSRYIKLTAGKEE